MAIISRSSCDALFGSNAKALVNPVNCDGESNAGLSQEFERLFPDVFRDYASVCRMKGLLPGTLHTYHRAEGQWIVNLAVRSGLRQKAKLEYVTSGLVALRDFVILNAISSIAIPPLGYEGGLSWSLIKREIETVFNTLPSGTVDVHLITP
jgi:O-acetyl-ADP-ribose deacetylase (regulator of RNase III)